MQRVRTRARLALRTRLALFISAGIVLAGLSLVLFLNLALRNSLSRKPALLAMAPKTVFIKTFAYKADAPILIEKKGSPPETIFTGTISVASDRGAESESTARTRDTAARFPPLPPPPPPLPQNDSKFAVRLFSAGEYDHLWTEEVARRLNGYSLLGVVILAGLAFCGSRLLSRRAMQPLTEMATLAGSLNAADLTPRLEAEGPRDEITQLAVSFNGMLDRLQAAFREMEQFNAFASHELRNALAVVRTRLEVGLEAADHREALRDALAATVRLSRVVDDMLAISTPLTAGNTEPVDLALAAAEAVDTYSRPGRSLELDLPEEGVPPVRGQAAWLQRAIANLLDNAFKYGPENGPVRVTVAHRDGSVTVAVADRGPGIPREARDRIWESYRRLGQRQPGTGLGLALVKRAVEAAGGRVWVESEPGEGSTFYLEVPAAG